MGVVRAVKMPSYEELLYKQIKEVKEKSPYSNMDELMRTGNVFEINE